VTGIVGQAGTTQRCGFLLGTRYHFQMRCRRSSARGYWSEWSPGRNYTTHEKAPAGKLDAWWSARPAAAGGRLEVQLRWKAPRPQEANGRVLGYCVTLSPRRRGRDPPTVCNTTHTQCNFSAPAGTRRVYLSAYNAAGESAATEVILLERKGEGSANLPWCETSAHPTLGRCPPPWQPHNSQTGCCSLTPRGGFTSQGVRAGSPAQAAHGAQSQGKEQVRHPGRAGGTGGQCAPSYAPKLHLKSISKSDAKLCWDPVPVEMQNGFITSYTIFWANSTAEVASAAMNSSLSSFVIRELKPSTLYKVHIMASTAAGSTNGTSLTLVTMVLDDAEIQFLFLTLGLIFVLLMLLLICFQKNGRVKKQFWPSVPDPANSSLGKWVPAELQQEPLQVPGVREPGLATISTVTVLERAVGKQPPAWGKEPTTEPTGTFPALPQPYVRQQGPGTPGRGWVAAEPRGSGGTVQYARVVGDGYKGQHHAPPRLHLRSGSSSSCGSSCGSRQPLLPAPSPSPGPYENMWFHEAAPHGCPGHGDCPEEPPATFPLLQGLRISGAEELRDC
ncbi:CSF3R factor, partial [Corythaeola cristata]|nr:CSF3R factor [Corythaeola cristata]